MASSKERPLIFSIGIDLKIFATVSQSRDPDCGLGQDCVCSTDDGISRPKVPLLWSERVGHTWHVIIFSV